MPFKKQIQYQQLTLTPLEIVTEDKWHQPWSLPDLGTKVKAGLAIVMMVSGLSAPVATITPPNPEITGVTTSVSSPVQFSKWIIYENETRAIFVAPETIPPDKWNYPWSEPVRIKPRLLEGLQQAQAQVLLRPEVVTFDKWNYPWSEPVRVKPRLLSGLQQAQAQVLIPPTPPPPQQTSIAQFISANVQYEARVQYQSQARPVFTPTVETVTLDKWFKPFDDPVRHKIGLRASLQQAFIAPVLADEQITGTFESRWHQSWSEPVRFRRFPTAEQQAQIQGAIFVPEVVTVDKWVYPWTDPVRQKIGLRASLQQALIAPVLADDQITGTIESRWHQAWSEPVRFRRFPTAEQQALIQGPPQTPEFITVDKWIYAWSEPVRQKIGLKVHLQQAYIAPVLNPETQIIQDFESRWHQPWSEPVRVKRPLLTAQQQAVAYQSAFFETINIDKWGFAWSEPVRQKIGLKANLQQAFIGLTLNPETQIIQNYESRWHFAWSEPIRRKLGAENQPAVTWSPFTPTAAFVFEDSWHQPWSEPVRQKIGSWVHLRQQEFVAPVIPTPVFVPTFSSPVIFQSAFQYPTVIQGPVQTFEYITFDKLVYAWSEPVRQKIGIAAYLQQALIAPILVDEQVIGAIEARWHQPWSEPVRFRRFPTAEQTFYAAPATSVFETITVDKWIYAWSEPVRQKIGIKANLQQAFIGLTLNPETQIIQGYESRWHQPWSEPVRPKASAANQPTATWNTFTPGRAIFEDDWHQAWSEPVRQKIGLRTNLQQAFVAPVIPRPVFVPTFSSPVIFQSTFQYPTTFAPPAYPILTRTINWFAPLNEPVRLKIGLWAALQRFFQTSQEQILADVTLVLSATEVNTDSAFFGVTAYNAVPVVSRAPTTVVSIKEIPAVRVSDVSIEEQPAIDNASVSIEET